MLDFKSMRPWTPLSLARSSSEMDLIRSMSVPETTTSSGALKEKRRGL
jgi:hypothetical protein